MGTIILVLKSLFQCTSSGTNFCLQINVSDARDGNSPAEDGSATANGEIAMDLTPETADSSTTIEKPAANQKPEEESGADDSSKGLNLIQLARSGVNKVVKTANTGLSWIGGLVMSTGAGKLLGLSYAPSDARKKMSPDE